MGIVIKVQAATFIKDSTYVEQPSKGSKSNPKSTSWNWEAESQNTYFGVI